MGVNVLNIWDIWSYRHVFIYLLYFNIILVLPTYKSSNNYISSLGLKPMNKYIFFIIIILLLQCNIQI